MCRWEPGRLVIITKPNLGEIGLFICQDLEVLFPEYLCSIRVPSRCRDSIWYEVCILVALIIPILSCRSSLPFVRCIASSLGDCMWRFVLEECDGQEKDRDSYQPGPCGSWYHRSIEADSKLAPGYRNIAIINLGRCLARLSRARW